MTLGIIAEDKSDVAVIKEFTIKLLKPKKVGFKHFIGHGCGKLRRKCRAWADNLVRAGCPWIVLIHDLDQNIEARLRSDLETAIANVNARSSIVLIPIRELEAWLLYDPNALRVAFNGSSLPRLMRNPQLLDDPKLALRELVWRVFKKEYVNTVHNERIAKNVNIVELERSSSFKPFGPFIAEVKRQLN